jgi:ABC-type polysaccharide/polyol phosphate export permease
MALVRIDLRKRYRNSILGIGWSLLHPIAMTAVFCVFFSQAFDFTIRDYVPYLLTGFTFWAFLTASVHQGCQCFFQGESYIRQQPAPLAIYPLRTMLGAGFHYLLGLGIVLVFIACTNGLHHLLTLASLIPSLVLLFFVGWSLAVCMGIVNVMFQDTQHLAEVVMQILFYATPIFYKSEKLGQGRLMQIAHWNPLAMYLELIRKPLLEGQWPSLHAVGWAWLSGLLVFSLAIFLLNRFEKRIIFFL